GYQVTDLIAGHVLFGFAQVQSSLPMIHEGKLNALAVTSGARSRFLPEIPSFAELGHGEFTTQVWYGLMVRAGPPAAALANLLNAAKAAHADADVKARFGGLGYDISGETGPGFAADIKTQAERWARLVKASGFKADGG